uniref:Uncharacterized protein n=1 Tax=Sinocyclocheilus anshuiensis TaxID=1608454 RepID=A0A671SDY5_9TELE
MVSKPKGRQCGKPKGRQCGKPKGRQCGKPKGRECGKPKGRQCGKPKGRQCGNCVSSSPPPVCINSVPCVCSSVRYCSRHVYVYMYCVSVPCSFVIIKPIWIDVLLVSLRSLLLSPLSSAPVTVRLGETQ